MRDLADGPYAASDRIQVVLDNLSTHTAAAFYETFAPDEARRVLRKLEFHYVPKHASWLNMVEIEIGVLARQCLARRIPDLDTLTTEVDAWHVARNAAGADPARLDSHVAPSGYSSGIERVRIQNSAGPVLGRRRLVCGRSSENG